MARMSISLNDADAVVVEQAAQAESLSASRWVASLIRRELLDRACRAAAAYDREHHDTAWEDERFSVGTA